MSFALQAGGETVTRPTFWRITHTGEILFYYLAGVAILVFLYGLYGRFARYTRGSEDPFDRLDDLPRRVLSAARVAFSNEKQFNRDLYAGVMHAFIVWGFLTLLIGTTILGIDIDIARRVGESFWTGDFYLAYSLVMDAMGLLFVVGIGMALYRRYWVRSERLWGPHTSAEDHLFVWSLFFLGLTGFLAEGLRILGTGAVRTVSFEQVSFVGWFLKDVFAALGMGPALAAGLYRATWWVHAVAALGFIAAIPYAKPFHMISSFTNVVARDEKAGVRLPRVPEDTDPQDIGPSGIDDFSWKQLLDHDACTNCGRCSSVCPAKASGRPLDPREVVLDLKEYRQELERGETEERPIVSPDGDGVIDAVTMDSCMSCMACMDACPVEIEHVPQFTEMNRRLTESGEMDRNVQDAMMNVFQNGNSFGDPERKRPDWTDDLEFEVPDARDGAVEYLWYVGEYPSYDERNRRIARSLARIFEDAGVSYGILYEDERHDGNDVRRVGEEGLYEMLVEDNAAAIGDCEYDRIVTTSPHAYNTFKNEYPEFEECDWTAEDVAHYSQVVEGFVSEGRLSLATKSLGYTVTYHDPCHLGRMNEVYEAPRSVVRATGCELHEMPRNRANSYCCGGGGGGVWIDAEETEKASEERLREAVEDTAAGDAVEKFVVACPQCATMYEDGRKTGGYEDQLEVVGVTELVAEAIAAPKSVSASGDAAGAGETVADD